MSSQPNQATHTKHSPRKKLALTKPKVKRKRSPEKVVESGSPSASAPPKAKTVRTQLDEEYMNRISALITECTTALNTPLVKPTNPKPPRDHPLQSASKSRKSRAKSPKHRASNTAKQALETPSNHNPSQPTLDDCPQMTNIVSLRCAIRLLPGMPLKQSLLNFCHSKALKSAYVVTCVGSLRRALLRFACGQTISEIKGPLEIVSLVGTLSGGQGHLHISLSNNEGRVIGGHLIGDDEILTTAEVVICDMGPSTIFEREQCARSGWPELTFKDNDPLL